MYTKIQVVFDAAEPEKLAEFWGLALGYVPEPPPEGFASWEEFAADAGIPEDQRGNGVPGRPGGPGAPALFPAGARGQDGKEPRPSGRPVAGQQVRGEERKRLVSEHVERLVQAGASIAWRTDDVRGDSITLFDPEGNEFCVT